MIDKININNKNKKLLAIDLDGTLLTDDKKITKENLEGLQEAIRNNTIIAIATGRELFSSLSLLEKYDFEYYLICFNGAMVMDLKNNEKIFLKSMGHKEVEKIVDFCIREGLAIHIFGETYWGVTCINDTVKGYMKDHELKPKVVNDAQEIKDIDIVKLVGVEQIDKVTEFNEDNNLEVSYTNSMPETIDIMAKNVTKGNGLEVLADKLDFDKLEIISIGNYYNDVDMFEISDVGVAIQNSPDGVKKHADYTTKGSNNNDAIREVIEKFILK